MLAVLALSSTAHGLSMLHCKGTTMFFEGDELDNSLSVMTLVFDGGHVQMVWGDLPDEALKVKFEESEEVIWRWTVDDKSTTVRMSLNTVTGELSSRQFSLKSDGTEVETQTRFYQCQKVKQRVIE